MKTKTGGVLLLISILTLTLNPTAFAKDCAPPPIVKASADTNAVAAPNPQSLATNNAALPPAQPTAPTNNVAAGNGKLSMVARIVVSDNREVRFYATPEAARTVNVEDMLVNGLAMRSQQQQVVAVPAPQQSSPTAMQAQAAVPAQHGQQQQIPPPPYQGKHGSATLIFNRQAGQWYEVPDNSVREYLNMHQGSVLGGGFGYNDADQQVVPASYTPKQSHWGWRGQRPFVGGRTDSDLLGGLATVEVEGGIYAQPTSRQKWTYLPTNATTFRGTWPPPRR